MFASFLHGRQRLAYDLVTRIIWLTAIILVVANVVVFAHAAPQCLRFADSHTINQIFIDGGPSTKVLLCPSKTYRLKTPIVFTAADQELATEGYPTGPDRATVLIAGDFATAIQGDCRRCAHVAIKSLVIDGNRKGLGRIPEDGVSTGLVILGGTDGQVVQNCWMKEPRGFTALHIREGDSLGCHNALVENNEIGPAGNEYDPKVDGPDPETSPIGRPLADGLSLACRDSIVRDNTFHDVTSASIVIFCSPGSLIQANHISAVTRSALAGILMVDASPFEGDYSGLVVKGNIIDARSHFIRVGIGIGTAVLSDDTETVLHGGSVIGNGIRGRHMGFGIAAAGLSKWTVTNNWDESTHGGVRSDRCFDEPINPDPMGFLHTTKTIVDSKFQAGFVDEMFEYIVCNDEQPMRPSDGLTNADDLDQMPVDAPRSANDDLKAEKPFSTGSDVMDEILDHSQHRMLETILSLGHKIDFLARTREQISHAPLKADQPGPLIQSSLAALHGRIEALEARQNGLLSSALGMRKTIKTWDQQLGSMQEWEYDLLLDVSHKLNLFSSPGLPDDLANRAVSNRGRLLEELGLNGGKATSWSFPVKLLFISAIGISMIWLFRRWRNSRRTKIQ